MSSSVSQIIPYVLMLSNPYDFKIEMIMWVFESHILPLPPMTGSWANTSSFPVDTKPIVGFL